MPAEKVPARFWNRNFTLLWQGQVVSSIGKQTFALAAMLWLKHLTGSGTLMGLSMTAALLPMVLLGPVAGVLADRWRKDRLIAWTDLLGGLLVLAAAFLFFVLPPSGTALIGVVFAVTVATGLLDTFSQPAIGASLPDLVPPERLEAANSLNLGGVQAAVFVAQGLAGLLFVLIGMPTLVLANALTYLYAGGSELLLKIPHRGRTAGEKKQPWQRFREELLEGFRFVLAHRGLRTSVLLYMALNFFIAPVIVLLPFFVEDYLALGPQWYGYLMAAFGLGALLGYLVAGALPARGKAREVVVAGGLVAQSALVPVLLLFPYAGFQLPAFVGIGMLEGLIGVNFITLLQAATPPAFRGRVQSLATTASAAVMPLGMALAGIVFDLVGQNVPLLFSLSGGLTLLGSLAGLRSKRFREFLRTRIASRVDEPQQPAGGGPDALGRQ